MPQRDYLDELYYDAAAPEAQTQEVESDADDASGISDESEHPELDAEYEMNAELADPETGYLLGKSNIANHLW